MAGSFDDNKKNFVSLHDSFSNAVPKNTINGFSSKKKEEPFEESKNTASKKFSSGTQSDKNLERHIHNGGFRQTGKRIVVDDKYIRYTKANVHKDVIDVTDNIAEKNSFSSAGDGAFFEQRYKKNGKLVSDISLAEGRDRISSQTRFGNAKLFLRNKVKSAEKFKDASDIFRKSEEETIDTKFDDKSQRVLAHIYRDSRRNKDRYKAINKDTRKQIREIEREIKAEQKLNQEELFSYYFNSSKYGFSSNNDLFTSDDSFKKNMFSTEVYDVNSYFTSAALPNHKEDFIVDGSSAAVFLPSVTTSSKKDLFLEDITATNKEQASFSSLNKSSLEHRKMTKQEKLEQKKAENTAAKKAQHSERRKMAAAASFSHVLETKKNLTNEIMGNGQITGDLLVDGTSGLSKTAFEMFKSGVQHLIGNVMRFIGSIITKLLAALGGLIMPLILPALSFFMVIFLAITSILIAAGNNEEDEEYDLSLVNSETWVNEHLTPIEISSYIARIKQTTDLSSEQEQALRYALGAVGAEYVTDAGHFNLNDNSYDCSELAYRALRDAGIDISNAGNYSAAEECRALVNSNRQISSNSSLQPGDLIFYRREGREDRFKSIGHVSIYLGKIDGVDKVVQAYGTGVGVIISDVDSNNIASICRPFS